MEEASIFPPNARRFFNLFHENIFFGRHLTVIQRINVSIAVLDNCCATIAQTPAPAYANAIPRNAEKIVPPNVA